MFIEEKINLLGNEFTNETNNTDCILKIIINFSISAECSDLSPDFNNYHWVAKSQILIDNNIILKDGLIGYGGSNNKQYDHKTWDTVSNSFMVSLKPGETLIPSITIEEIEDNDNTSLGSIEQKIIGYIIGVHDNK